ncbi:DUF6228 family protein [Streptomyces sp. NPDC051098]|uniref:DUF6228 family protein n=1 Tax=Streptomyces sp. NPDC051098 TaxID=3155411 RepID=UPI0034390F30
MLTHCPRAFTTKSSVGFLSSLVEDFRGWEGARACRSLERDLTISAEHHTGGYVVGYPRSTSVRGVALRDHHRARGRRGDAAVWAGTAVSAVRLASTAHRGPGRAQDPLP